MGSYKYEIFILSEHGGEHGGELVATCRNLDIALIVVKGLMTEYYAEPDFEISVQRSTESKAKSI